MGIYEGKFKDCLMPFGCYRGKLIHGLPINYLLWLQRLPDLRDPLKGAVAEAIEIYGETSDYDETDFSHPGNPAFYGYSE